MYLNSLPADSRPLTSTCKIYLTTNKNTETSTQSKLKETIKVNQPNCKYDVLPDTVINYNP